MCLSFDLEFGEEEKVAGMAAAALKGCALLEQARKFAKSIALSHDIGHTVSVDDVQRILTENGYGLLGNAAGSLFRNGEWEFSGAWRKSSRTSNHARENRLWYYIGAR